MVAAGFLSRYMSGLLPLICNNNPLAYFKPGTNAYIFYILDTILLHNHRYCKPIAGDQLSVKLLLRLPDYIRGSNVRVHPTHIE